MTYGGGLFEPLEVKDSLALSKQFKESRPGFEVWARARHFVQTRDDIAREKRQDR